MPVFTLLLPYFFFCFNKCLNCIPGQYMTEIGKTVCSICDVGKQSPLTARKTDCEICVKGKYQSERGTTACLNCIPGFFNSQFGQINCTICAVGRQSSITAREEQCNDCIQGRYQSEEGTTAVSFHFYNAINFCFTVQVYTLNLTFYCYFLYCYLFYLKTVS